MSVEEWSLLARWSGGVIALLDAGSRCEMAAAALLRLFPQAKAAQCQLDESIGGVGQASEEQFLTAAVEAGGRKRGQVRVALPLPAPEGAATVLDMAARVVALALPLHQEDDRQRMELVSMGEAAGSMIHAINNHLNAMVLQAACVQMLTQPPVRDQADHIRREGARAAARLRPLQAVRPWPAREGEQVDLIEAVRDVLRGAPEMSRVQAQLPAETILVPASMMGVRRMLTLLFRVALRCTSAKERVLLRIGKAKDLELILHLPGVQCQGESGMEDLPEAENGSDQVEREAARWLVRQTGGRLETSQGKEGAIVTVRWEGR